MNYESNIDNKEIDRNDIQNLIVLGMGKRTDSRNVIMRAVDLRKKSKLLMVPSDELLENARILSDEDLRYLYMGLIHLERESKYGGGSVSSSIFIYRIIMERGIDSDHALADYGLKYSSNPYVPFGNHYDGEKSYSAYVEHMAQKKEHRVNNEKIDKEIHERAQARKDKRKNAIAELRKIDREDLKVIREKLKEEYADSSIEEKFTVMVNDGKYPPEYYPIDWAVVTDEDINNVSEKLLHQFYHKLSVKSPIGHWKRLCKLLSKYSDEKFNNI